MSNSNVKSQMSNVLIVGLGKSGLSAAAAAQRNGATVWVYDDSKSQKPGVRNYNEFCHPLPIIRYPQIDLVITSPGIPFNHPVLKLAAEKKWSVASEVEFAYNLLKPQFVIGVTGTNGKTTVVELLNNIYKLSGKAYTLAGNIGCPLSSFEKVENTLILELSSFQLHFINRFRANIGVILNITEDHFDWHCCFGQYMQSKLRIFENQKSEDIAILNIDDQVVNEKIKIKNEKPQSKKKKLTIGKIRTFGLGNSADYCIKEGYLAAFGENIIAIDEIKLKGDHNYANVLAAMACAHEAGIDWDIIKRACRTFKGLKHRLQFVAHKSGVDFYNDSKSTNPDATRKAIESFNNPVILILGGRNKGNDFTFIKQYLGKQLKEVILFGEASQEISQQINSGIIVNTVEDALSEAVNRAKSGDKVVFSPGCASFDQFNNYGQRGESFIKAVEDLG